MTVQGSGHGQRCTDSGKLCAQSSTLQTHILLIQIVATSFGLYRPSPGQNMYKTSNTAVYIVLFVSVMRSHLQSYSSL